MHRVLFLQLEVPQAPASPVPAIQPGTANHHKEPKRQRPRKNHRKKRQSEEDERVQMEQSFSDATWTAGTIQMNYI